MTIATRRQKIEAMLADDPQDVFLRYSLAMEQDKEGDHGPSLLLFRELMKEAKPYVPAFFSAARQQARLGNIEVSRAILRDGIEEARRQGDSHAAGEMSEFLASLGNFGE